MFTIDAHLDLSMNAMEWNRDLRKSIITINEREQALIDKPDRGKATVSLAELRKGNIGLVVATQIARYVAPTIPCPAGTHPSKPGRKHRRNWPGIRRWKKMAKWCK